MNPNSGAQLHTNLVLTHNFKVVLQLELTILYYDVTAGSGCGSDCLIVSILFSSQPIRLRLGENSLSRRSLSVKRLRPAPGPQARGHEF